MLEFQNISIYKKKNTIVDNLTLSVPDGAVLGLLGEDRKGKSAILEAAAGCRMVNKGQILLDGTPVFARETQSCRKIGYMPGAYGFYQLLKVEEYYELILSLYKIRGRDQRKRLDEVLAFVELEKYRDTFIGEMPAECYPFLYLGQVILPEPEWLLLDEPFGTMDSAARRDMARMLQLLFEGGTSIIINAPMYQEIMDFVTDIAVMEEGKLMVYGPVEEVYAKALLEAPVRMQVLSRMETALEVLKQNHLVDRVTVDGDEVIFRFNGGEREEARLLSELVTSGVLIRNYMRDQADMESMFRR
ncbi:MAG: ABC transporter ATP-binding protein [Eubacterium sp.]|nr:ABC transporter ATP-binding protein [Eubacterium sp.]MDD7210508.1 ABC transporter ATP-binding protein [Lachnospiraceae bacterium]MDY5497376.1 ABC transporter ATP-binding protein [Anaerobutyricum sp.]